MLITAHASRRGTSVPAAISRTVSSTVARSCLSAVPLSPPGSPRRNEQFALGARADLLGALAALASSTAGATANAWNDFARQLAQHHAQAVVWAPLTPRHVDGELTRWADVFCLHPAGGLRRRRGGVASDEKRRAEGALHIHAWRVRATEAAEVSICHARPAAQGVCAARVDEA